MNETLEVYLNLDMENETFGHIRMEEENTNYEK